jgi:hypothetical protein
VDHVIMTATTEVPESAQVSTSHWLVVLAAFGVPAAFLFSIGVVVLNVLSGQVMVRTREDLRGVDFGWPTAWVHQDQSSADPPLPRALGFDSPWEHPTGVSPVAFLVDVLMVFAAVSLLVVLTAALVVAIGRGVRRRTTLT